MYSYYDSSDDDEFMPKAFQVDGELAPDSGPPSSGLEYLKHVRWETKRCERIVVSDIDPREFDSNQTRYVSAPTIAPPPLGLEPNSDWEKYFVRYFETLRKEAEKMYKRCKEDDSLLEPLDIPLPHVKDANGWKRFCLGLTPRAQTEGSNDKEEGEMTDEDTPQIKVQPNPPLVKIIMRLDAVSVTRLVQYHILWIESTQMVTEEHAQWLFALLTRLETPVDATTASALRSLLRECCALRAQLENSKDPRLPPLQILITIASKYFGQSEKE